MKEATSLKDMSSIDGEECASFREACRRVGLLIANMERKNALQKRFRSHFFPLMGLFASVLPLCLLSEPKNIYDGNFDIILQYVCCRRRRNNSTLLQADRDAESYDLLEL